MSDLFLGCQTLDYGFCVLVVHHYLDLGGWDEVRREHGLAEGAVMVG